MPGFFIDRPIFAWVIAILITLAGGVAIFELPVSAYPPIAPPQISINAVYPGASAEVIEKTVTAVIEGGRLLMVKAPLDTVAPVLSATWGKSVGTQTTMFPGSRLSQA